jgi:YD repeat-containing protein
LFDITRPFYSSFAPQGRFFTTNRPAGINTGSFTYDAAGNVIRWDTNGATTAATGFNRSARRTIAVPLERYLFAGRGNFEFTEGHSAFFEGTYASSNSTSKLSRFRWVPKASIPLRAVRSRWNSMDGDPSTPLVVNPLVPAHYSCPLN